MLGRLGLGDLLDLLPLRQGELRRMAALVFRVQRANPSALTLRITSRTRSSLVKATLAIAATSMPCADSSTICARRQVTTDQLPRRMIRTSRCPSSSSISRTRSRSVTGPVSGIWIAYGESPGRGNTAQAFAHGSSSSSRILRRPVTGTVSGFGPGLFRQRARRAAHRKCAAHDNPRPV